MTEKKEKPNILIIMTDQHRADMMTCAGRDEVPTPNIDRIAENGIRFTNAYCPYPVCLASRSSFLTGLYAHNTGAINNNDRLDWRYRTMVHHFSDNDYLTGLIGKMHFNDVHNHGFEYYMSINDWLMYLGPDVYKYANEIANHPLNQEHFYSTMIDDGAGFPDVANLWEGSSPWVGQVEKFNFDSMSSEIEAEDHLDMFIARETEKFLKRYQDQKFFLVASFMKPHTPFFPPEEYAQKYPVEEMELPEIGDIEGYPEPVKNRIKWIQSNDDKLRKAHRAGYRGNLDFVDDCIGRVYDTLEELGLMENTIVVYTSDHGEMDGDHGLYQKFCLFEPAVKVPLIVSYPDNLPENEVTEALTEYMDLYPTLADLTDTSINTTINVDTFKAKDEIDASSFSEILYNPDKKDQDAIFSEYALRSETPRYMIREKRYKFIYNDNDQVINELYDLKEDPGEEVNLILLPVWKFVK
ncbi:MAG: sulfatase [Halanaerobiaceae bacterium]